MKKKLALAFSAVLLAATPVIASAKDFTDVSKGHWALATIKWGTDTNVVTGYPDGTFKPEKQVSEEEFLTMLISAYIDRGNLQGASQYWSDPYYYFANNSNYPTEGWDRSEARRWKVTRQHVAEIMTGASGKNYTGTNAIKYLLAEGLAKGKDSSGGLTIEGFKGSDYLTRAEAIQFIKNAKENGLKELKVRPLQPSDPSSIPELPIQAQPSKPETQIMNPPTPGTSSETTSPGTTTGGKSAVKVVPSTNPDILLPSDITTEPAIQAFLDSLKLENGTITGIIPDLPNGHVMVLTYTDKTDKNKNKNLSTLKEKQSFSIHVSKSAQLTFGIFKGNDGKNEVYVKLPDMTAEWGSKH